MTHLDIYTHYRAHCDLATREVRGGPAWSGEHSPAPWLHIVDVAQFVSLHLTRLADGVPLLQKSASKNLQALIHSLNHRKHEI